MYGTVLAGKYRVLGPLGAGGMGTVHEAEHLGTGRHVAVKLLSNPSSREIDLARFEVEARALGELEHPNIVDILDFGVDEAAGIPYLVMELLYGEGLDVRFSGRRPVRTASLSELSGLLEPVARALDFAHARGIVHRDVKPSNIFISESADGTRVVKLLDFGLATGRDLAAAPVAGWSELPGLELAEGSRASERLTREGTVVGTPHYIAPEVAQGERASPAADRYALAVVAFEALTGFPPFPGDKFHELISAALAGNGRRITALRPDLPPGLEDLFVRALSADPGVRPATALALVNEIRRAGELEIERKKAEETAAARRTRRSRESLAAILFVGLVTLGAAFLPATSFVRGLEGRSIDLRLALLPPRPPSLDLLFVVIDEASLAADPTPLASQAETFGEMLQAIFDAGARSLAVDFLLPPSWAESPGFSRMVRKNSSRLTLAAFARSDGTVTGHEAISGLTTAALGPEAAGRIFGLVNLEEDVDGYLRRARPSFADGTRNPREAFAARVARLSGPMPTGLEARSVEPRLLDGRIRWRDAPVVSWKDLRPVLLATPGLFHDRSVVVGGDFEGSGDDLLKLPSARGSRVSGVFIQGLVAESFVSTQRLSEVSSAASSLLATLTTLAAFGLIFLAPWRLALSGLCAIFATYLAGSLALVEVSGLVLPVASVLLSAAVGAGAAGVIRLARSGLARE